MRIVLFLLSLFIMFSIQAEKPKIENAEKAIVMQIDCDFTNTLVSDMEADYRSPDLLFNGDIRSFLIPISQDNAIIKKKHLIKYGLVNMCILYKVQYLNLVQNSYKFDLGIKRQMIKYGLREDHLKAC